MRLLLGLHDNEATNAKDPIQEIVAHKLRPVAVAAGGVHRAVGTSEELPGDISAVTTIAVEQDMKSANGSPAARPSYLELQATVNQLQKSTDADKQARDEFRAFTAQLVLCQASFMVLNKLTRRFLKAADGSDLLPWLATKFNLNNLRGSKKADKVQLEAYLAARPDLENGLSLLADTLASTAHSAEVSKLVSDTGNATITMDYLKDCLEQQCPAALFPERDAVDAVLAALDDLSENLGESLFVPTSRPPNSGT